MGSRYYLPSSVNVGVEVRPLTFAVGPSGLSALLIILALALALRRLTARGEASLPKATGGARREDKPAGREVAEEVRASVKLFLPQISPPFPEVWGLNDPLTIAYEASGGDGVELFVNGVKVGESEARRGSFTYSFRGKGVYEIALRVKGLKGGAVRRIRVVKYGEEIAKLFKGLLEEASRSGLRIYESTTPREALAEITSKLGKLGQAEEVVSIFERVRYGRLKADRKLYEKFYLAYLSVAEALRGAGR